MGRDPVQCAAFVTARAQGFTDYAVVARAIAAELRAGGGADVRPDFELHGGGHGCLTQTHRHRHTHKHTQAHTHTHTHARTHKKHT